MRAFASLLFATLLLGCSHDDDHGHTTERPAVCEEIGSKCHDSKSTLGQTCHESAHDTWTEAQCNAEKAKCLAECATSDAGADTGAADTGAADTGAAESGAESGADAADGD